MSHSAGRTAARSPDAALADAEERRAALVESLAGRTAELPLRYWRQSAHLTVPGSDGEMLRKAFRRGTAPVARLLERVGATPAELADALGTDPVRVEQLLARPRPAPAVVVDLEDAQTDDPAVRAAGMANAIDALGGPPADAAVRGDDAAVEPPPLRFLRPPAIHEPGGARELLTVVLTAGRRLPAGHAPLDAVVLPKVRHPDEVVFLHELLAGAEHDLGIAGGSIRVALLIESGWGLLELAGIVRAAAPRLCALVFGPADFASDVGLPEVRPDHPVAAFAEAQLVVAAGAAGVPALAGMTFAYPVADAALDASANRTRVLERLALVHADARRAHQLGMRGKWVGHPAQLFVTLLAFDAALADARIAEAATIVERYRASVAQEGRGATIVDGSMVDRATDRHERTLLRTAVAEGRFAPDRALALGVIDARERAEMEVAAR